MTLGSWKDEQVKDLSASPSMIGARADEAGVTVRPARRRVRSFTPYLFLFVPIVLLLLFTYVPIANMLSYSFVKWNGLSAVRQFVGIDNYVRIFTQPELFGVFFTSLYYFIGAFVQMAIALYLATMLSFSVRFRNLIKGIIFFPYLINGVAISFIFLYVLKPDGVLDTLLAGVGINDTPLWTGDRSVVNVSLASVSIWRYLGLNFVLFLGAIQSIPSETLEAGEIDGASRWALFRHIIVPGIRPVIGLSFILAIAGSLAAFEIPYVMLGGANGSATFVILTIQTAFTYNQVGLASAMAAILLVLILAVTLVQRRIVPDERVELI